MSGKRRLMIGNTIITAKVAQQLMAIAIHGPDGERRNETFNKGVSCARQGGQRGDCPWRSGITAKWWQEGFDYAAGAMKGGA